MTTASNPLTVPIGDALLEIASGAVLVVDDVSWRVVAANPGAERLYGGPLVGLALENLFALDGERAVERTLWRAQNEGVAVGLEFERRDGARRRVRARARRVALDGCTVAVLALDDVTREWELERALEAARGDQRSLVDALGIGVVALDTSGRVIDHNSFEPLERSLGPSFVGRNFFLDVATSPDARAVFQRYQAWAHALDRPAYRERFEFDSGRALVEAELHAGVGVAGWDALVRLADATDRRAAEQELRRQSFEAEEAARRTRLVYQTASLIHRSLDLGEVFATATAETGRLLGASRCLVALVDEASRLRVEEEYFRPHLAPTPPLAAVVEASPTVAEAVRALHPVAVESVDGHPLAERDAMLAFAEARAAIVAPIAVRREARGVLVILQCDRPRRWTSGEVDLAASVASQVGLAIGHVEIHERVRRQADREAIVGRLAAEVHAAGTLEGALERAASALADALGAERAAAALAETRG
jgi:PAS domain-containing protein